MQSIALRVLFVCYVRYARFPQMLRACVSLCLRLSLLAVILACQGFATQRVVATTLHKVPEYAHKKTTALTVVFLVRPQGLEPWTH